MWTRNAVAAVSQCPPHDAARMHAMLSKTMQATEGEHSELKLDDPLKRPWPLEVTEQRCGVLGLP